MTGNQFSPPLAIQPWTRMSVGVRSLAIAPMPTRVLPPPHGMTTVPCVTFASFSTAADW